MNKKCSQNEDEVQGSTKFKRETLQEICRMAAVSWWPVKTNINPSPVKFADERISLVETAHVLGNRARANDQDALLRLFIMMTAAQLELWQISKESKLLQRAAEHCPMWFFPRSPFRGLSAILKKWEGIFNVAALFLRFRKMRGNLDCPANACAYKLLAYMVLAKRALITDPRYSVFQDQCVPLPRLSSDTWQKHWWPVGRDIAKGMFPKLDEQLFGDEADPNNNYRNYSAAMHHLGLAFKNLWPMFVGIENA